MTDPQQQISFVQYVDGSLLQIIKMLSKVSEVATALEAELFEKTKLIERLEKENNACAVAELEKKRLLKRPTTKPTKK